jgi:hypothetical protein
MQGITPILLGYGVSLFEIYKPKERLRPGDKYLPNETRNSSDYDERIAGNAF